MDVRIKLTKKETLQKKREYYQKNRVVILSKEKIRQAKNRQSLNYRKLCNYRKYLCTLRYSIEEHGNKIKETQRKMKIVKEIIEVLEFEWGKERALWKKSLTLQKGE